MIGRNKLKTIARAGGFTLIEVLVASTISAVLIVALYAVFHGALNLRESAFERLDDALPRSYVSQTLRRDLAAMTPPAGIMAGALLGESNEDNARRADTLEFYTASAAVGDNEPWGDIQKVEYRLAEDNSSDAGEGRDFVRAVTRNLLASTVEEPPEEALLSGVESLEFSYYDGEIWEESWDSTTRENEAPLAVRVRIDFASNEEEEDARAAKPFELLFEVVAPVAQEIEEADSGGANGGQQPSGGGDGGGGGDARPTDAAPAGQRGVN